ncbi:MAG: hypothetical protein M9929_09415 [Burkholderiaceae bacterium]|nr:hypothetical protein [Burkholderiaceae bacterium]
MVKAFEPIWPDLGMGRRRKAPIKRFAEVIGYSENAAHHKVKNGAWVGSSMVLDPPERREHHQQGGAT